MTEQAAETGIAALAVHVPPLAVSMDELAKLRGIDPAKLKIGLGCREMALCPEDYGVVELATEAARRDPLVRGQARLLRRHAGGKPGQTAIYRSCLGPASSIVASSE